jgi:hypothetical protein
MHIGSVAFSELQQFSYKAGGEASKQQTTIDAPCLHSYAWALGTEELLLEYNRDTTGKFRFLRGGQCCRSEPLPCTFTDKL